MKSNAHFTNLVESNENVIIAQLPLYVLKKYEPILKRVLGKTYTFRDPVLSDGVYTLIYQWYAVKRRGALIPEKFVLTVKYDPGPDTFTVTRTVVDSNGGIKWESTIKDIHIDSLVYAPDSILHDVGGKHRVKNPAILGTLPLRLKLENEWGAALGAEEVATTVTEDKTVLRFRHPTATVTITPDARGYTVRCSRPRCTWHNVSWDSLFLPDQLFARR